MARVYLKGLPELKKKLVRLQKDTAKDLVPVIARAADEVVAMMKRLVPVQSGDLRDSIGWTFGEAPKGAIKLVAFKGGGSGSVLQVTIYAGDEKAFYARWVEFGTQAHTIRAKRGRALGKGGRFGTEVAHPGGTARPFFWPSWRANKKPIKKAIAKAVQESVRRVSRT